MLGRSSAPNWRIGRIGIGRIGRMCVERKWLQVSQQNIVMFCFLINHNAYFFKKYIVSTRQFVTLFPN